MQRRRFLKTLVLVAGGVSVFGCGEGGGGDGGDDPGGLGGRTVRDGTKYFPQSIASGDPKPESVILWARVEDSSAKGDLSLIVQVALDEDFAMRIDLPNGGELTATAVHDGCVRVRVDGLEAGTAYYYRFAYLRAEEAFVSRTGRTKTAPDASANVSVKFAVASCQDYVGRYFHPYKHMAEQDLDFVIHLGDYIYETTGDPSFQSTGGERSIVFGDPGGAIELGQGEDAYQAASELDNYRDLYKIFRSDPDLQRVHERFPMIAVWDDHEFSDDSHGQSATYLDGREDERSPARRTHADQAWFEFMPVDYADPEFEYDPRARDFPDDITIYRDFTFGKHLHVVMTDLRRYRDDHLIPEDAFPGRVAATQSELMAALGDVPEFAVAYVDLDSASYADHKASLNENAEALGFLEGDFAGNVGVDFVNDQLAEITDPDKPDDIDDAGLPRGITFAQMFKTDRFSYIGARYAAIAEPFDAYARVLWTKSKGKAQQVLGDEQEEWFIDTIRASKQTWKIWGNEYTLMTRRADLREVAAAALLDLNVLLYPSVEDWDGMPDRRAKILDAIGDVKNVVAVSGDIHAFFAGVAESANDESKGILEFVAGAISSTPYKDLLYQTTTAISPLAAPLAESAQVLLEAANPHLAYVNLENNGYGIFTASSDTLTVTFVELPGEDVQSAKLGGGVEKAFATTKLHVAAGKRQVRRESGGKTQRWDARTGAWVEV